jgi:large subunit ribosomal protein L23
MPKKEQKKDTVSDEELDKMIDDSIKKQKKEDKEKEKPKKEEKPKEEAKPAEEEKSEEKPAEKPREEKPAEPAAPAVPEIRGKEGYDPWKVLIYPHLAEKSMNMVELENKLVFIVKKDATKSRIKEAVENGFNVKVLSVNVEITMKGQKKAYIKLSPEHSAADIATRLGMI